MQVLSRVTVSHLQGSEQRGRMEAQAEDDEDEDGRGEE